MEGEAKGGLHSRSKMPKKSFQLICPLFLVENRINRLSSDYSWEEDFELLNAVIN